MTCQITTYPSHKLGLTSLSGLSTYKLPVMLMHRALQSMRPVLRPLSPWVDENSGSDVFFFFVGPVLLDFVRQKTSHLRFEGNWWRFYLQGNSTILNPSTVRTV